VKKLAQYNEARNRNAAYLSGHLKGVVTPYVPDGYRHVYHQYTVRVEAGKRDGLIEHLHECGIGSGVFYPVPVHKQSFYQAELGYADHLPVSELVANEVVSLPVHPGLSEADLASIAGTVNEFIQK
jgi:perosamine synthetase